MKAVIVFCEGSHDVAFATRSLGVLENAEWMRKPIRELPSPFGPKPDPHNPDNPKVQGIIVRHYSARLLDDLPLTAAARPPLPSFERLLYVAGIDTVFALVRCHGDGTSTAAMELLGKFQALMLPGFNLDVGRIAAAFLFDADDAGVAGREASFAASYTAILDGNNAPRHGQWVRGSDFPVGLYLFHDRTTRQGTLEDLLVPMVETQWRDRWKAAGEYLADHQAAGDPVATKPAERRKAQICITGQFLFPGDPMTMVIERNGLPNAHFSGHESQALVDFLTGTPWT